MDRSRREFLKTSSAAMALSALGTRVSAGHPWGQRLGMARGSATGDPVIRDLALRALDAARAAGATYADVRFDVSLSQELKVEDHNADGPVVYHDACTFSVRVIAKGQLGSAASDRVTPATVARVAQEAVAQARVNAAGRKREVEFAPAPPVPDGRWETPIEIDPFTVSIGEQQGALLAATEAALKVKGIKSAGGACNFYRTTRTFASTDGSFIVQTRNVADPRAYVRAAQRADGSGAINRSAAALQPAVKGYEVIREAKLVESLPAAAESALRAMNPRTVDVGRYDVVMAPSVMAELIQSTLGWPTDAAYALGKDQNGRGVSFTAPPRAVLGTLQLGSPLLTLTADRNFPGGLATVGWDDEGVAPEEATLIQDGILRDYQTTRETAAELAWWYQQQGRPVRSHGYALAYLFYMPDSAPPNLAIRPAKTTITVDDLIKDVKKGIYMSDESWASIDPEGINVYLGTGSVQEIRNGKLVGYLADVAIQFRTQTFWKSMDAIGGPASVVMVGTQPWPTVFSTVRAIPARFRQVNVVNTGRTQ